jgi:2-polyprenyl-6-methoxyphenol hydroxylase-like FAD-dependent oxidoreductase
MELDDARRVFGELGAPRDLAGVEALTRVAPGKTVGGLTARQVEVLRLVAAGKTNLQIDFITAQGIRDAFRDAELCAAALDEVSTGVRPFDLAMREYQEKRDAHVLPIYELTCEPATLEPPPPEMQQVLGAVHGNQEAMDGFARVVAGATSPAEYFSAENVRRLVALAR